MKDSKFFTKLCIKNIVFPFIVLGFLLYTVSFSDLGNANLGYLIITFTYPLLFGGMGFGILSTYYIGKENEVIDYLYENKFEKFIEIFKSLLLLSVIVSLIPMTLIVVKIIFRLKWNHYSVRDMTYFFITYILFNIFFITLGGFIGLILKGYKKYIVFSVIGILLILPMTDTNILRLGEGELSKLLNVGHDYSFIDTNLQTSILFNREFFLDKLFILITVLTIIIGLYFLYSRKNKVMFLLVNLSLIPIGFLIGNLYINSYQNTYDMGLESSINRNIDLNNVETNYFVDVYNMEIDTVNEFSNRALLNVYCGEHNLEDLEFKLDKSYYIEYININDEKIEYSQNDNTTKISKEYIEKYLSQDNRNIILEVKYRGNQNNEVFLFDKEKIWYPMIDKNEKLFEIKIKSEKPIKSNLKTISTKEVEKNHLTEFSGVGFSEVYLIDKNLNTLKLPYETYSYDMNIDTTKHLKNKSKIRVKNNSEGNKELKFLLYQKLDIEKLEINNKKINYKRKENEVIIDKKDLPKEDFYIYIDYSGEINLRNEIGMLTSYVYSRDISLVDETIPWYPMFGDLEKDFNIKVKSKVDIFSNLDRENHKNNIYKFKSKDIGVTLIGGNMVETKYKDYIFIVPKAYIYSGKSYRENLFNILIEERKPQNKKIILVPSQNIDISYNNTDILDFYIFSRV